MHVKTYFIFLPIKKMKYVVMLVQQQQPSLSPKTMESAMDPQQTNLGRPHVFFFIILSYSKSYYVSLP